MGGAGRKINAGVYSGGAGALVNKRIVPEYFHGFNRSGKAGGDGSRHLYGRRDGAVIVGGGDDDSPGAGEGGGQSIGGTPMLQEDDGAGGEDEDNREDKVLTEAFFRGKNPGRIHKERHSAQISRLLEKRQIGSTWELRRGK